MCFLVCFLIQPKLSLSPPWPPLWGYLQEGMLFNHFQRNRELTTKVGLTNNLRRPRLALSPNLHPETERHLENGWKSDPPLSNLTPKGSPMVQGFHLGPPSTGLVARARWMWIASFPAPTWLGMSGIWRLFHPSSSHFNAILTKGTLRYDKSMWWKWSIIDVIVWGKGHIHAHTQTYADTCTHTL